MTPLSALSRKPGTVALGLVRSVSPLIHMSFQTRNTPALDIDYHPVPTHFDTAGLS